MKSEDSELGLVMVKASDLSFLIDEIKALREDILKNNNSVLGKRFITAREAGKIYGVKFEFFRAWAKRNNIEYRRFGKQVFTYSIESIEKKAKVQPMIYEEI